MELQRYISVKAIKTKNNELIPVWDKRLEFENSKEYSTTLRFEWTEYGNLIDCLFDLKTKTLSMGIELNYYPKESELEFRVNEIVYHESSLRKLTEVTIVDIEYLSYELTVTKGKKIDSWWIKAFPDVELDRESLYAIKNWKPSFVLSNGVKTEWSHQLYHRV